ncbi:acyltransferase family protein [Erwinia psidii]|nr:acyltransferase family protein [Erwinia psidii]
MNTKSINNGYRSDIDGLRCLAVTLVILFHAGTGWFSSGFIGVDIFFVISGYLISGIILTQSAKGNFRLGEFLNRRLWRIQPALLVASFAALLVASFLYVVPDYLSFMKSAKYNALFLSNQFFAKQSVGYASPQSEFFPLLHTWSLSIEWQWYLILPAVLMSIGHLKKRFSGQQRTDYASRGQLLCWMIMTVIFASISLLISAKTPGGAYYFLMSRIFEFTAGGTAFLFSRYTCRLTTPLLSITSCVSILSLTWIASREGIIRGYPDGWTLAVVILTAAVLFSGAEPRRSATRFLSISPLPFVGKLSYSLYLWHWPVFAFCRYLGINLTGLNLFLALTGIFIISVVCFFFIEQPLRRVRLRLKWTILLLVAIPAMFYSSIYALTERWQGIPQRLGYNYSHQQDVLKKYESMYVNRESCLNDVQSPERCQFGEQQSSKSALMIGDSNSNHFWGFFDVLGKDAHIRISAISTSSCLALPGIWQYDWWIFHNTVYSQCHDNVQDYYRLISEHHYNYVVLGELWEQYPVGPHLINQEGDERNDDLSRKRMALALKNALDIITEAGSRPIIITSIFAKPENYQQCINLQAARRENFAHSSCNQVRVDTGQDPFIRTMLEKLKSEYPALQIIDPRKVQCPDGKCISQIDSIPLYRDVGHLTDYASSRLGQEYLKKYGNPMSM